MTKVTQPQILVHDNDSYERTIYPSVNAKHDENHNCDHCGNIIPSYRPNSSFCCNGCEFVYQLINNEHLERFYQLAEGSKRKPKIFLFKKSNDLDWVDAIPSESLQSCEFSVEGMECAACVWLIKTLSKRLNIPGIEVNSAMGRFRVYTKGVEAKRLKDFFVQLQNFGYHVFPLQNNQSQSIEGRDLLLRIGVVAASVMNSMIFSFAMYLGLTAKEPFLFSIFSHLNFLFCTLAVGVGGSYFFRKAWAGIKMRVFHFDFPVSIGVLGAYLGSTYSYLFGNMEHVYFDTLCAFIFLMLVGRFLQVRWVEKNRASISSSKELESMTVKRIGKFLEEIPIHEIQANDQLMISSGSMIPVACKLISPESSDLSLEWISGEGDPVNVQAGQIITAGAQNLRNETLIVSALQSYKSGDVSQWMFSTHEKSPTNSFWQTYAQKYSWMVLSFLAFGFLFYAFTDLERAIRTAITISLVTCPCGIGIGIPMAQMIAQRKLLSSGIYLRDLNLLEHLKNVKRLVFDKTGTLTLGDLHIKNPESFELLSKRDLSILFNAVSQSQHPVSRSIYNHLLSKKILWEKIRIKEIPGLGLDIFTDQANYFLGRSLNNQELVFKKENIDLLHLSFEETLLEDANPVFTSLKKQGYEINLLSGDKLAKVSEIARRLDLEESSCVAQCTPQQKEAWIANHEPESTFFLGDGLNDSLALRKALISGVSLSSSWSLASNANFYFSTLDIRWLPTMLELGKTFSSVVRGNVAFSIFYNTTAVTLAIAGYLTPLAAAIVMPAVSLFVVAISTNAMKKVKLQ